MAEVDSTIEEAESWLEGMVSIMAALAAGSRPVYAVYIQQGTRQRHDRKLARLVDTAVAAHIPVQYVDEAFISQQAGGGSHGGVLARVGPRRFVSCGALLAGTAVPFIAMLDGIEDPFNFGQAVRALYAAGADGLVLRPRNWLSAAGTVARASAGASEWLPTAVAETAEEAAAFFRQHGLVIACASHEEAISIFDADLTRPLFLLIGGEKRGITRSFLRQADVRLQIPYGRANFQQSLGTAAATAVISFEIMRQRQWTPKHNTRA
ncbi:MAG TPA: RNA methyltransferase [Chloroflexota bacterium]|nr:RNA methyltransferase [Chloroflexota bacterium]